MGLVGIHNWLGVVLDMVLMDFLAVVCVEVGLLDLDTLLWLFLVAEEDDFLAMLLLFHKGVQITRFLDASGVILMLSGVH